MNDDVERRHGPPYDFDDPADLERLAREIHEGAERGKAIAALRPDGRELGKALTAYADIAGTWVDNCAYQTAVEREVLANDHDPTWNGPPWLPAIHSPAQRDHDELVGDGWDPNWLQRDNEEDFGRVLFVVHKYFDAALDHLRGVGVLLRESGVIRPPCSPRSECS